LSKYISRVGGKPYCKACIKDVEPGDQSSISDDDDDDDDETEYTDCSDDDFDEDEEETMFAYLHNFPVQLIFQEKCFGTFDELLMNKKISSKEIIASLFQITIILATYQKLFNFTHNDLHTNNIMYVKTDIEHIEYKLNNTIYRIPTYGRIFKLIDFGRAIYQFNGHQFCSDSFAENGDANSQSTCEPSLNPKKPRIDPNPSFDLCRLGCSLYDFTMDTDSKELKTLVDEWCEDDYGKNILYKSSGEERYPGFKLYKMIARIVNNLVPLDILSRKPIFSRFAISAPTAGATFIDIDEMPIYVNAAASK
jgi:serine/threonine protein kinase